MGLGAWLRSLGGCCGCCGGEAAAPEKEPLLSNNNPYASFGATLARDEEQNLWSTPHDVTHTEADDDRVLYNMIVVRNQLDKDSEVRQCRSSRLVSPRTEARCFRRMLWRFLYLSTP
ncbi:melanoregulin-like [Grus americana]|uniref:melanoregulin-like n=1 Tax=Grus americana TaxID=9117 RepID=UPI00240781C0|nr:melanoregulin-like [Grus americana]